MQEIHGALRVGSGGEDHALVGPESRDPAGNIGRVVVPDLRDKLKVGAQEGRADLRRQFLHRIRLIAEALLPEVAIEALFVPSPMDLLMS